MRSLLETKSVADTIVKLVLSSTGFIVPISETAGEMVYRAIDEDHLRNMEEAAMTVADDQPSITLATPHNVALENTV